MEKTPEEIEQHNQEMLNKFEETEEKLNENLSTDEEKRYAGKFTSVEDLEKSYQELQKKLGSNKDEEVKGEEIKDEETKVINKDEAKDLVNEKGFDYEALSKEYIENGELSEETYKKLEDTGIPKEMIDSYVKQQEIQLNQTAQEIYKSIGGEDNYKEMLEWASDNLSEEEKTAFNSALDINDNVASFTIQNLYSRFKNNTPGTLINGDSNSKQSMGYETKSDMIADMGSEKYKRDARFRAIVQKKVEQTKWL